jgi:hypothetical protein
MSGVNRDQFEVAADLYFVKSSSGNVAIACRGEN